MGSALNQHTTSSHLPIAQNVWLTILAANFRGRRLSRISWFCGYSRKFSPWNLGVWYPLAWHEWAIRKNRIFTNSQKFSPLKVSCYMVVIIVILPPPLPSSLPIPLSSSIPSPLLLLSCPPPFFPLLSSSLPHFFFSLPFTLHYICILSDKITPTYTAQW